MEKRRMVRNGLILIGIGIIIGLIISAGFDFTRKSDAYSSMTAAQDSVSKTSPPNSQEIASVEQLSNAFADLAERVTPSVVTISTETVVKSGRTPFGRSPLEEFFGDDFFQKFFQQPEREQKQYGLGSGVIISSDGIILTNNHVVKDADDIKIRLIDGSEYSSEVKGTDSRTDLAVIKIDAKDLPAIKFGDSDKARVGEWVMAIGSPLSPELAHTVTSGIISAKGRSRIFNSSELYEDFIQTDAAINPGNSGGALVNIHGELIGINTAIASRTGGFMGIGFAIPSNLAQKVKNDILQKGRVVRGWLGVYIQDVNPDLAKALNLDTPTGALVASVQKDSPAEKAGLKAEDVILKMDGRTVRNSSELRTWIASQGPDSKVKLTVLRDNIEKDITVTLGELPEDQQTSATVSNETTEKIGIDVSNISSDLVKQFNLKIDKGGVVITDVQSGSVAAQAGLRPGDVILKINRKPCENIQNYNDLINDINPGETVLFYVQRDEAKIFVAFSIPKS
ncbi:MAG: DegQ family serine endoprotease [Calditrichia bacterium]